MCAHARELEHELLAVGEVRLRLGRPEAEGGEGLREGEEEMQGVQRISRKQCVNESCRIGAQKRRCKKRTLEGRSLSPPALDAGLPSFRSSISIVCSAGSLISPVSPIICLGLAAISPSPSDPVVLGIERVAQSRSDPPTTTSAY